jgi:hypothetical protein
MGPRGQEALGRKRTERARAECLCPAGLEAMVAGWGTPQCPFLGLDAQRDTPVTLPWIGCSEDFAFRRQQVSDNLCFLFLYLYLFIFFETGSVYVVQAGLELSPPKCWDHRCGHHTQPDNYVYSHRKY